MSAENHHRPLAELEAGLEAIRQSPADVGVVRCIVRRPKEGQREVLEIAQLDTALGLVGDNWLARGSRHTTDRAASPDMQLTVMNARAIALIAVEQDRWALAGDQLYVDLDLSVTNLPPGARLAMGTAVIEITAEPHTGCKQFAARFGNDAVKFVNSPTGRQFRLRGPNAKVIQAGTARIEDAVKRVND